MKNLKHSKLSRAMQERRERRKRRGLPFTEPAVKIVKVSKSAGLGRLEVQSLNTQPSRSFRRFEEMMEVADMPPVPKQLQRENAF